MIGVVAALYIYIYIHLYSHAHTYCDNNVVTASQAT